MSDELTRTRGVGFEGPSPKTRVDELRIQVRFQSGKIYGPYKRTEIVAFIFARRLKGDEDILLEGESKWRPITSDVEFYDAFQDVLTGKKAKEKKKKITEASAPTKVAQAPTELSGEKRGDDPVESDEVTRASSGGHVVEPPPEDSPEAAGETPVSSPQAPFENPYLRPLPSAPLQASIPNLPPAKSKAAAKSMLPLILIAVAALGYVFVTSRGEKKNLVAPSEFSAQNFISSIGRHNYGKVLQSWLAGVSFKVPGLPSNVVGGPVRMPEGFGADFWVKDLQSLLDEKDTERRSKLEYWLRLAWDLQWLGETVVAFDRDSGEQIKLAGQTIITDLGKRKLLDSANTKLFQTLPLVFGGQWANAESALKGIDSIEIAQWLAELCSWMNFWVNDGSGALYRSASYSHFSSVFFDLTSSLRKGFSSHDKQLAASITEMSDEAPFSFELWFNAAQFIWRMRAENIQVAQKVFATGLATLSLVPASFQSVYWTQFSAFLAAFGQGARSRTAAENAKLVLEKNIGRSSGTAEKWWDLGQDGLDLDQIAQGAFDRLQKNATQGLEVPTLVVLGALTRRGPAYLAEAGYHFTFQRDWIKAIELFEKAQRIDKSNLYILGGLIWSYSNLFHFDKAFRAFDDLKAQSNANIEAIKYLSVIQMQGREYDQALAGFQDYLKQVPNNGWGHYYYALLNEKIEKNVDCAKAANLARVHSAGELKGRATMLFFRCRILAKIAIKETLRELEEEVKKDPSNIPLLIEWIDGQANADLTDAALKAAQEGVARFPRSYELRLKLADVYEKKNKFDMAMAFYNDAKKDKPESPEASVRIARIFERQERFLQAAQNFETAARIDSNYPDVWIFAARNYEKAGKFADAAQMYIREIEARPAVLQTFIEAAEFMLKINAPQEVPKIFQKFSEDFHGDPRVLTRLAQAYWALKDVENARQTASMALASDPKIPEANRVLGVIYDSQGQYEEAKRYFQAYLSLLPQANDADQIRNKINRPPYPSN